MRFTVRKSKRLGPFRLNLSRSGVRLSTGIGGVRVSQKLFGKKR